MKTLINNYGEKDFINELNIYVAYKMDYKLFDEFKGLNGLSYEIIEFLTLDLLDNIDINNFNIDDIKKYLINQSIEKSDLSKGCGIVVYYDEFDQFLIKHKNEIDQILAFYPDDNLLNTLHDYNYNKKGYYNINNLINDLVQLAINDWTRQLIDFISNELDYNELIKILSNNLNKDNCRIFE